MRITAAEYRKLHRALYAAAQYEDSFAEANAGPEGYDPPLRIEPEYTQARKTARQYRKLRDVLRNRALKSFPTLFA